MKKGDGYFYFAGPAAANWLERTVKVPTLGSLRLDQWLAEFDKLKELNAEIQPGVGGAAAKPTTSKKTLKKQ